jgi:hypothetical protein
MSAETSSRRCCSRRSKTTCSGGSHRTRRPRGAPPAAQYGQAEKPDPTWIAQLQGEIGNLVEAIATGALRSSPALAARLEAAESELARLKTAPPDGVPVERLIPRIEERYQRLVTELQRTAERDPQRARQAVIEVLGDAIPLRPENGRADRRACLYDPARSHGRGVGNNGSGGRI